jgi:hypothetical protein
MKTNYDHKEILEVIDKALENDPWNLELIDAKIPILRLLHADENTLRYYKAKSFVLNDILGMEGYESMLFHYQLEDKYYHSKDRDGCFMCNACEAEYNNQHDADECCNGGKADNADISICEDTELDEEIEECKDPDELFQKMSILYKDNNHLKAFEVFERLYSLNPQNVADPRCPWVDVSF